MLKNLFNRNPTAKYPLVGKVPLEFDLESFTINGLPLGASLSGCCECFGQATGFRTADKTRHTLEFGENGLILEISDDKLCYIGLVIANVSEHSDDPKFSRAMPVLMPEKHQLTPETTVKECCLFLGSEPVSRDADEDETVLTFHSGSITFELEFFPRGGGLKTFSVFPTD